MPRVVQVNVSLPEEKDEKFNLSSFSTRFHRGSQSSLWVSPRSACLGRALGLDVLAWGSSSQDFLRWLLTLLKISCPFSKDSRAENFSIKQIDMKQNGLTLPFPKSPFLQEFVESVE